MKNHIVILVFLSVLLGSCKEDALDRTIFIPDKNHPELPAYSEWGYNSFGAFYERETFVSTSDIVPCKIVYDSDGILNFSLSGRLLTSSYYSTTLTFSFPLSEIKIIDDLSVLHDLEINLTENCTVELNNTTLNITNGKLHFRRFQLLRVDDVVNRIILSGTFEIRFFRNGLPESISSGRFDMGITDRDFHSFAN